jgi:hypothetical protein
VGDKMSNEEVVQSLNEKVMSLNKLQHQEDELSKKIGQIVITCLKFLVSCTKSKVDDKILHYVMKFLS